MHLKKLIVTKREIRAGMGIEFCFHPSMDPEVAHLPPIEEWMRIKMRLCGMDPGSDFAAEQTPEGHVIIRQKCAA